MQNIFADDVHLIENACKTQPWYKSCLTYCHGNATSTIHIYFFRYQKCDS